MSSSCAATSTASEIAIPSEPVGCAACAAAGVREVRRRAVHGRAPGLHHRAPVGLLVVAGADHEDLALEPEQRAGERQRRAPLAGAGLGRELLDARPARSRRPAGPRCWACASRRARRPRTCRRSSRACRAPARAGARGTAASAATAGRRRGPASGIAIIGSGETSCIDQRHREDRRQVVGAGGLAGLRVQRRQRLAREVGEQVDPVRRDGVLAEDDTSVGSLMARAYALEREGGWAAALVRRGGPKALTASGCRGEKGTARGRSGGN